MKKMTKKLKEEKLEETVESKINPKENNILWINWLATILCITAGISYFLVRQYVIGILQILLGIVNLIVILNCLMR